MRACVRVCVCLCVWERDGGVRDRQTERWRERGGRDGSGGIETGRNDIVDCLNNAKYDMKYYGHTRNFK